MSEGNAKPSSGGVGCLGCLGVIVVLGGVALAGTLIYGAMNPRDACDEAREARVLSQTLDDPDKRTIAAMQYVVKAQECADIGGSE
ncbi:hypothetical protein [Microbacterium testaceum]|uniref:hypothetical protein n=1 Tax=Microbacterium testaceum TaxID=2033 RepID=UPI0012ACEF25|nr:hypothetical protein [Microbacterium testaceum]